MQLLQKIVPTENPIQQVLELKLLNCTVVGEMVIFSLQTLGIIIKLWRLKGGFLHSSVQLLHLAVAFFIGKVELLAKRAKVLGVSSKIWGSVAKIWVKVPKVLVTKGKSCSRGCKSLGITGKSYG